MNKYKTEGYTAYQKGQDVTQCPYEEQTYPYEEWVDGWLEASEDYDFDER